MPVMVLLPAPLQELTGGVSRVEVPAGTLAEAVAALEERFPGLGSRLCDEHLKLRRHVNVFVNEDDVRRLEGERTRLRDGDEVWVLPSIAGG